MHRALAALAVVALTMAPLARAEDEVKKTLAFADAPEGWKVQPASKNPMGPKVEYEVAAAEGSEAGKLTVHHFGSSMGGDWKANLERWCSQFTVDGKALTADKVKVEDLESNGIKMKLARLAGTWTPPSFNPMAKKADPKPDSAMLAVMIDTSEGPFFIRLVGSAKTVAKHEEAYLKWLKATKLVEKK